MADYLHYRLRRFIWAYCDDDDLSNEEVLTGQQQGIRVAIGGRECPNREEQKKLFELLGVGSWDGDGAESVSPVLSGYFFAHPRSRNLPPDSAPNELTPSA